MRWGFVAAMKIAAPRDKEVASAGSARRAARSSEEGLDESKTMNRHAFFTHTTPVTT